MFDITLSALVLTALVSGSFYFVMRIRLGQIDKLFGVPATTRNWNTILAVVQILKGPDEEGR